MFSEERCHFIYVEIKSLFLYKVQGSFFFFFLKGPSSSKGFYAQCWIINEVMNCSCCLLFCQSAVWLESRLTLCASDPWKAARRRQIEPGIEYVGEQGGGEARFLRSPLNGAGCVWGAGPNSPIILWVGTGKDGHDRRWQRCRRRRWAGTRSRAADVTCHSLRMSKMDPDLTDLTRSPSDDVIEGGFAVIVTLGEDTGA